MKLLLAIPYYAPAYAFGGSVTVAETIVSDFLKAGHEVTVITTDVLDPKSRIALTAPAAPPEAEVVRFRNANHWLAAGFNGYLPRGMRGWLARNVSRFDVVLLHDFYSAVSVLSARAAARAGVPFALQPLGTLTPARTSGRPVVKRCFLTIWGHKTVRTAAAILYLGQHEANDARRAGAVDEQLIYMPLPLELPTGVGAETAPEPTIVFVGRLHPVKRVDQLLEAVAIVRRQLPEVRLDVVGPGGRFQKGLEAVTQRLALMNSVVFHGYVSSARKLEITRRAHVSALLSSSEGLPMAVLEAMACAKPVVLSHGCHLDELDDRAGLVVSDDPADAARALIRLLSDDELRRRLGDGAAEFAQEFRREDVMPKMVAVLEEIAGRHMSATRLVSSQSTS